MFSKISIFILFLLTLISCDNPIEQTDETGPLLISFKNNTDYDLNNILVDNKLIGNLHRGSSTKYFTFDNFTFDTGMPDEDASAELNGQIYTNHSRGLWCGTEKVTVYSGKYLIEIGVADTVLFLFTQN